MTPNLQILILIPCISALIGWLTNYFAVKMIFRPHNPVNILGLRFHGLIPRRQEEIAHSIGTTIEEELISHHDLRNIVAQEKVQKKIVAGVDRELHRFIDEKLVKNPMIGMFLEGDMGKTISQVLMSQLRDSIPDITNALLDNLEGEIDFKELVRSKIQGFDLVKLETITRRIAAKELKMIELFGGVLGFIVGLGQAAIILLSS